MTVHDLKIWPVHFDDVASGLKKFECRVNDRDYQPGDKLNLYEWWPDSRLYSGRDFEVDVTYVMAGGQFGIEEGWCVLGLGVPSAVNQGIPEDYDASA